MSTENLSATETPPLELLIFSADACSVCHAVKPRLINMCERYKIPYRLIDTKRELEYAAQLIVFTVPTVLLMMDGREIRRESRFIDFAGLEKTIAAAAESI